MKDRGEASSQQEDNADTVVEEDNEQIIKEESL